LDGGRVLFLVGGAPFGDGSVLIAQGLALFDGVFAQVAGRSVQIVQGLAPLCAWLGRPTNRLARITALPSPFAGRGAVLFPSIVIFIAGRTRFPCGNLRELITSEMEDPEVATNCARFEECATRFEERSARSEECSTGSAACSARFAECSPRHAERAGDSAELSIGFAARSAGFGACSTRFNTFSARSAEFG
jgi:hypothetical protein